MITEGLIALAVTFLFAVRCVYRRLAAVRAGRLVRHWSRKSAGNVANDNQPAVRIHGRVWY
jgi:hypothetical protein